MTAVDLDDLEIVLTQRANFDDREAAMKRLLEQAWKAGWDACEEEIDKALRTLDR